MTTPDKNYKELKNLKNVGKLAIRSVEELALQNPTDLFYRIEKKSGRHQDPCVWDVFAAIIHEAKIGESTAWREWAAERKALQKAGKLNHVQ